MVTARETNQKTICVSVTQHQPPVWPSRFVSKGGASLEQYVIFHADSFFCDEDQDVEWMLGNEKA